MLNIYDIGTLVRLKCSFFDLTNALVDPTTVTLSIKLPDTSVITVTPIKDSTGIYYYDYQTTQVGNHFYRYTGTGIVVAAGDKQFFVQQSPVLC